MLKMLDLFSGIGGFSLAASWTGGIETVAFCEIEPFCQKVLKKHWPDVPIYSDIKELRGEDIVREHGAVDIVCGGFPCPAFSRSGKSGGFEQDDLFFEMLRLAKGIRPKYIVFENVEGFTRWRNEAIREIEAIGYEVEDAILDARDFGIPQARRRWFAVCFQRGMLLGTQHIQGVQRGQSKDIYRVFPYSTHSEGWWTHTISSKEEWRTIFANCTRSGVIDGIPDRIHRLKALGNSIVPQVVYPILQGIVDIEEAIG